MHNLPTLAKGPDRCTLMVNPTDAQAWGLTQGTMAQVQGPGGSVQAPVEISDSLRPGVVSLPHGFGQGGAGVQLRVAAQQPGANLNALLAVGERDPLSGNAVLSGVAVQVSQA